MHILLRARLAFDRLIYWANWLGSMWIFCMMLIVVFDVAMRFAYSPVSGPKEIIEASIIIILYLQIAHTLKSGRITRSDAFYMRIVRSRPTVGHLLGAFFCLAGAGLMAAIMWEGWFKWIQSFEGGFYIGAVGVFAFPEWPVRLTLFVGCGLMGIQFLLMASDAIAAALGYPSGERDGEEPRST
jgi:TRAP-type mannitol/chloroaromatic compound transport system permease small subunit